MGTRYNAIAGQSVERLAALSDGLFAVAMTLLVLDLKVPAAHAIETERALQGALWDLLGWSANATQPFRSQRPAFDLDPSGVPVRGVADAFLDFADR
jgi:hypothetical protein